MYMFNLYQAFPTHHLTTQFQIEGGGVVQGVTKLKLKLCQLSLQKMGLNLHFQEVKSFSKRVKKNQTRYKRVFFLIIFTKKKH